MTGIDLSGLAELDEIPAGAFSGCRYLDEILLPNSLIGINEEAFIDCDRLEEVDIPDSVVSIGSDAFEQSILLIVGADSAAQHWAEANDISWRLRDAEIVPAESITTEKSSLTLMRGIGYTLSVEVSPLDTTDAIYWGSGNTDIMRIDDGYIRPLKIGETEILIVAGDVELRVPVRVVNSSIAITPVAGCVFSDDALQLTVRDDVTDNVRGAEGLVWSREGASITGNGLLSVTDTSIATVRVRAANGSVDEQHFACIDKNDAMNLPAAMKYIDEEAFRGDTSMTCVIVPDGAISIGDYAFADCGSLRIAYIP